MDRTTKNNQGRFNFGVKSGCPLKKREKNNNRKQKDKMFFA